MNNLPKTRGEALKQDSRLYFNGKPCPKGHIAPRIAISGGCVPCNDLSKKVWRDSHKEYIKEQWQLTRHGVSTKERHETLVKQSFCCAICGKQLDLGHHTHQDHCELLKKNRGILCYNCNVGLGYFAHSPSRLKSAALYIEEWRMKHVRTVSPSN